MNREIFREYDIRGVVAQTSTDEGARDIGRAVAAYMRERGETKASLGRDCRLSSDGFGRSSRRAWPRAVFPSRTSASCLPPSSISPFSRSMSRAASW